MVLQVCKQLRTIVDETPSLQFTIELSEAGYAPDGPCIAGMAKLEAFRAAQRAYRNPKPNGKTKLLAKCDALANEKWQDKWFSFEDFVVTRSTCGKILGLLNIRSDVPPKDRFRCFTFDFKMSVIIVEPSQDLLLLIEEDGRKLHFRSLSTGGVHEKIESPLGEDTAIPDNRLPATVRCWDVISIWNDWMYVCVDCGRSRFKALYHWPTGQLIKVRSPASLAVACPDCFMSLYHSSGNRANLVVV